MVRDFKFGDWNHKVLGNTWKVNYDGTWFLPERTLGWGVLGWCSSYLKNEDGNAWQFTPEQARIILWWYAVDCRGRFTYRTGILQRLKGWGKDPVAASLALVEMLGPVRFSHWGADGDPAGKPQRSPWVTVNAVSQTQTRNTSKVLQWMATDKLVKEYELVIGVEQATALKGQASIVFSASSYRAVEGNRPTFSILNEALALDTPIPTPRGWTTMGALEAGEEIFGSDGAPTRVTAAKPIQHDRDCYRVSVRGDDSIVASDGHLWRAKPNGPTVKKSIWTTKEMYDSGRPFYVPRAGARETADADLPVDPYLLGYWLGDGSTGDCNITVGNEDSGDFESQMSSRGVTVRKLKSSPGKASRFGFSGRSGFGSDMGNDLSRSFRKLSCFNDKHIPEEFMHAGTEQRKELLRGLMDSDGCYTNQGYCVFVGTERLAEDVLRLAQSLGLLPSKTFASDARSRHGGSARVTFVAEGFNPFSLSRKADRVEVKERRTWTRIRIEKVDSVPVRCISVEAEDSLFQAGNAVVTHNTQHWVAGNNGHEMFETLAGNLTKSPNGTARMLSITNAYMPGEDSVAEKQRYAYMEQEETKRLAPDAPRYAAEIYYDSLEADPAAKTDPATVLEVVKHIRGDSVWLDPESIVGSFLNRSIAVARSRRMFYNQVIAKEDALFEEAEWDACREPDSTKHGLQPGTEVVLGFDGGKSDDATALIAKRLSDGCVIPIYIWERPPKELEPDWEINREEVDAQIHYCFRALKVVGFYADVALWESYIDSWNRAYRDRLLVKASPKSPIGWDMRGGQKKITLANEALMDSVFAEKFLHNGNRVLRRHALNARRRSNAWGVTFGKESRESPLKVDSFAATLLAEMAYRDLQESGKLNRRTGHVYAY
ncbi:MAG: hypothetical protein L0K10_01925 [Brevibacterium aurantiacum]|nr:hypothetical protein [Brevibacterium aurantiacum]